MAPDALSRPVGPVSDEERDRNDFPGGATTAGDVPRETAPPSEGPGVLVLEGVGKIYAGRRRGVDDVVALQEISFAVRAGEFVSVVGPSGCGKSTILRLVAGLLPCTSGRVIVNGAFVTRPIPDVGIVFQSPLLLEWRKVLGNVLLPIEILGYDRAVYEPRALALLGSVGLGEFAHRYPHELSGGMQQRVAICRALIHDPPALIMDEPFSALDEITRDALNVLLLEVWTARRKTVLYITHSIAEAVFLSDRVAVLSARPGRVLSVIPVHVPRPRHLGMRSWPAFLQCVETIRETMGLGGPAPVT